MEQIYIFEDFTGSKIAAPAARGITGTQSRREAECLAAAISFRNPQLRLDAVKDFEEAVFLENLRRQREADDLFTQNMPDPEVRGSKILKVRVKSFRFIDLKRRLVRPEFEEFEVDEKDRFLDDYPYVQNFLEMGLGEDEGDPRVYNPMTDPAICKMNAVHFRELCYPGAGGRIYALHERRAADEQGPYWLRPETLQKYLGGEYIDAHSMARAFRRLGFDAPTVKRVLFGSVASGGKVKKGLRGNSSPAGWALYFEKLANELEADDADRFRREAYRQIMDIDGIDEISPVSQMHMIEAAAERLEREAESREIEAESWEPVTVPYADDVAPDRYFTQRAYLDSDEEEGWFDLAMEDPDMGAPASDSVYTGHPLFSNASGCRHEFLAFINNANAAGLKAVLAGFKRGPDGERPKYAAMTPDQRRQTYRYVWDRVVALAKKHGVSKEVIATLKTAKAETNPKVRRALLLSHANGRSFNYRGQCIRFRRPNEIERLLLLKTTLDRFA
jgi:hypothetical protein